MTDILFPTAAWAVSLARLAPRSKKSKKLAGRVYKHRELCFQVAQRSVEKTSCTSCDVKIDPSFGLQRILSVSGVADAVHIAVYYVGTILQETPERAAPNTAYVPSAGGYPPASSSSYPSSSSRHPGGGSGAPGQYYPQPGSGGGYGSGSSYTPGGGPGYPPAGGPPGGAIGNQTQQIYIPGELVGNIIGKAGAKINEIRQMSACNIKIMEQNESQGSGARANERVRAQFSGSFFVYSLLTFNFCHSS